MNRFLLTNLRFFNVTGQANSQMKKFYKQATFQLNQNQQHHLHKYVIKLDGKTIKTPYKHILAVPSKSLGLLVASQFNRQQKHLKTGQMPFLGLCRTAVDADIQGHLAVHLKHTIYQYLKTDTLLYVEEKFDSTHATLVNPLIQNFNKRFNMEAKPSQTLQPPQFKISQQFDNYINSLNNWQLIALQTMTIWMKSSICAFNVIGSQFDPVMIQKASYIQEMTQMLQSGEVQEKIMDINQVRMMVSCGQLIYRLSHQSD